MSALLYNGWLWMLCSEGKLNIVFCYIAVLVWFAVSYMLGSVNFAIVISKIRYGQDIRDYGSHNAGATNMLRTYGKGAAAVTLLCDILKAVVSVFVGRLLVGYDWAALCGLACAVGHAFPCWYKFKGGKCVAVTAAFILSMEPLVFLMVLAVFLIITLFTKYVSLGSIFAAFMAPVIYYNYLKLQIGHGTAAVVYLFLTCMLVVYMHRENIARLSKGEENRLGSKKKKDGKK